MTKPPNFTPLFTHQLLSFILETLNFPKSYATYSLRVLQDSPAYITTNLLILIRILCRFLPRWVFPLKPSFPMESCLPCVYQSPWDRKHDTDNIVQMFGVSGAGLSQVRNMQNGGKRARHSIDQWDRQSTIPQPKTRGLPFSCGPGGQDYAIIPCARWSHGLQLRS